MAMLLLGILLAGCAADRVHRQGLAAIERGDYESAVRLHSRSHRARWLRGPGDAPGPPRTPRAESRAEALPYCACGGMRASRSASCDELLLLVERLIREDERTVRERVHTVDTALERVADVDVIDAIALGEEE